MAFNKKPILFQPGGNMKNILDPDLGKKVVHDYLLTIGPDEETSHFLAYFREGELPMNLTFLKVSPIPQKAAYAIRDGESLHGLVGALLHKAEITNGFITVMPLRDFSDFTDRTEFQLLRLMEGFTFRVLDGISEHHRTNPGLDFC
jgi:hypothetical protein